MTAVKYALYLATTLAIGVSLSGCFFWNAPA